MTMSPEIQMYYLHTAPKTKFVSKKVEVEPTSNTGKLEPYRSIVSIALLATDLSQRT